MIVVLFLCGFIILSILILFILCLTTIKIDIKKIKLSNINTKIQFDYVINIGLYLFSKVKIFNINIDKDAIQKVKNKYKIPKINFKKLKAKTELKIGKKEIALENIDIKILKKLKFDVEKLKLLLSIGTIDTIITSFGIAVISSVIPILLNNKIKKYDKEKYYYKIAPIYNCGNVIDMYLNCIINVKMVHIMNIIYTILKQGRVDKNERTSNRRAYDYSYEQYPGYDRRKYNYRGTN